MFEIQKPKVAFGGRAVLGDRGPNSSAEEVLDPPGAVVTQPRAATCAVAVVGVLGNVKPPKYCWRNAAMGGVIPDGSADTLLRREDERTEEPVVPMEDIDVVLDEQQELAIDDLPDKGHHPPVLPSTSGVAFVALRTGVVFRSMVEGVDGIKAVETRPSDDNRAFSTR